MIFLRFWSRCFIYFLLQPNHLRQDGHPVFLLVGARAKTVDLDTSTDEQQLKHEVAPGDLLEADRIRSSMERKTSNSKEVVVLEKMNLPVDREIVSALQHHEGVNSQRAPSGPVDAGAVRTPSIAAHAHDSPPASTSFLFSASQNEQDQGSKRTRTEKFHLEEEERHSRDDEKNDDPLEVPSSLQDAVSKTVSDVDVVRPVGTSLGQSIAAGAKEDLWAAFLKIFLSFLGVGILAGAVIIVLVCYFCGCSCPRREDGGASSSSSGTHQIKSDVKTTTTAMEQDAVVTTRALQQQDQDTAAGADHAGYEDQGAAYGSI
ncbi:unnamed protein product [Amoebophrya sp. A120]|nr:unnamed protein product [Amoebophrya sp. A120]|eukprot:GSA120T00025200001.1